MKTKLIIMLLLALTIFQSCKKDTTEDVGVACGTVWCLNGGTCSSGSLQYCECVGYYEGIDCGTAWTDKYVGTLTTGTTPYCEAPQSFTITKKSTNEFYLDAGNGKVEFAVIEYDSRQAGMKSGQVLHYTYNGEPFHVNGGTIHHQNDTTFILSLSPINSTTGQPVVTVGGVCEPYYIKQ